MFDWLSLTPIESDVDPILQPTVSRVAPVVSHVDVVKDAAVPPPVDAICPDVPFPQTAIVLGDKVPMAPLYPALPPTPFVAPPPIGCGGTSFKDALRIAPESVDGRSSTDTGELGPNS